MWVQMSYKKYVHHIDLNKEAYLASARVGLQWE